MLVMVAGINVVDITDIDAPFYLFEFENITTKQKFVCLSPSTSAYPDRYQRFSINVIPTPNNLISQIGITIGGDYTFKIYKQLTATLTPNEVIYQGLMTFSTAISNRNTYTNNATRKAYQ
jgi:hypothetical protein